jgi:HD-GYP domain-containing protein (c-di-GMP phosphodiesterase class II)
MEPDSHENADIEMLHARLHDLQTENERLRVSIDTMLDGHAVLRAIRDEDGHIVEFCYESINPAGCRLQSRPKEEIIGHVFLERYPARHKTELFKDCVHIVETGHPVRKEIALHEQLAEFKPPAEQILDISAVKHGDGLTVTWRDITEYKHGETEIHLLNTRLRQCFADQTTQLEKLVQELTTQVKERERAATQASVLSHVAAKLNAKLDLNAVQKTICEEITTALHFDSAIIALLNPVLNTISVSTTYGLPDNPKSGNRARSVDEYIRRFTLPGMGEPLVINDVQTIPGLPDSPSFERLNIRTLMGTGMYWEEQLIGVLVLFSIGKIRQVDEYDLAMLKTLANQAALAINNAQLYEEEQARTEELTTLLNLSSRLREAQNTCALLPIVLHEIHDLLNVDACMIATLNPQEASYSIALADGYLASNTHQTIQVSEGIAKTLLSSDMPLVIHDFAAEFDRPTQLREADQIGPAVIIPIRYEAGQLGVLAITRQRNETAHPFTPSEVRLLTTAGEMLGIALRKTYLFDDLQQAHAELIQAYDDTIKGWSHALDLRDKETEDHTQRVTDTTERLAQDMGIQGEALLHIRRGAILHDIGKMGIPDNILLKPGPLTDEEWEIMRRHPQYAYEMLWPIQYLRPALDIPYCHHEWWNGSGYPRGLRGEHIPLAARIFAVVDVWDALSVDRPYRKAWPAQQVRSYLLEHAGTQFDPAIVQTFLSTLSEAPHVK